jgi:hypothetical protein
MRRLLGEERARRVGAFFRVLGPELVLLLLRSIVTGMVVIALWNGVVADIFELRLLTFVQGLELGAIYELLVSAHTLMRPPRPPKRGGREHVSQP